MLWYWFLLEEMVGLDDTTSDGFIDDDIIVLDGLLFGLNDGSNVG